MKKLVISLCVISFILIGCTRDKIDTTPKPTVTPIQKYKMSLFMVGDALLHTTVTNDYKNPDGTYDFSNLVENLAPIVSKYDVKFYNQETILGGTELGITGYPTFNSPQEFGDAMLNLGFNLVSRANNHTLDRGQTALNKANEYWIAKDVMTAGSYGSFEERESLRIYETNGIRYAFLAYTEMTNGIPVPKGKEYYVDVYSEELVKQDVEKYKKFVDVILVSIHFGDEYEHIPNQNQVEIAEYLASLDVNVVIGHHPHVIQPITFIDDTLVIYSLGNFVSAQKGLEKRIELMVGLDIIKTVDNDVTSVRIENVKADLLYNYYSSNFTNFMVYPFELVTDRILPNHESIYQDYIDIVTSMNDTIQIGGV